MPRTGPDYGLLGVRGIIGRFFRRFEDVMSGSWAPTLGLRIPSDQETETYRLLGMVPALREWRGGRLLEGLRVDGFTLTNLPYEVSISIDRTDFARDKTGQLAIRVSELARRAAQHWESIVTTLITDNGNSYDGVTYFNDAHVLGDSGSQDNDLDSGTVGALNVATATAPTEDEMVDVIVGVIQHMYSFVDDQGEPINGDAMEWAIMVPVNMMGSTIAAIRSNLRKSGSDNALPLQQFNVTPIVNPRLSATDEGYVFRMDTEMKSFILQDETGPEVEVLGPNSEEAFKNRRLVWGVYASRRAGYGEPLHSAKFTLS